MLNYTIEIPQRRIRVVEILARKSHKKWEGEEGNYENTEYNHFLGRVGEFGVADLVHRAGIDILPRFMQDEEESLCDITPNGVNLEVKTWTAALWRRFGRAVAVNQYNRVAEKADLIVWCTWDESTKIVRIRGCSRPKEMLQEPSRWTGPVGGRQVHNYQIQEHQVRLPHALADILKVPSGPEHLVPRAHRVLKKAYAMEVIGADLGNIKVRWLAENMTCVGYYPCDSAYSGYFRLSGPEWDAIADNILEDARLTINFSNDEKRISFQTETVSGSIPVVKGS